MNMKLLAASAAGALTLALSAPAWAIVFSTTGDTTGTQTYNGIIDGNVIPGLTATINYTLTGFTGTTATFSYVVDNTSSSPITASEVLSFGFNLDPNFSSLGTVTGTVFPTVSSGTVSGGLPAVEFCLTSGPNCTGGASDGLNISDPAATGSFTFNFNPSTTSVTFSDLYVRYQAISAPTLNITGGSGVGVPGNGVPIPEPATWAMMILGFGGIGAMMRRRRSLALVAV